MLEPLRVRRVGGGAEIPSAAGARAVNPQATSGTSTTTPQRAASPSTTAGAHSAGEVPLTSTTAGAHSAGEVPPLSPSGPSAPSGSPAPSPIQATPPRPRTQLQSGIIKPKQITDGHVRWCNACVTREPSTVHEAFADSRW